MLIKPKIRKFYKPGDVLTHNYKITPRQLDYWCNTGLITPVYTKSKQRRFDLVSMVMFYVVSRLVDARVSLQKIRKLLPIIRLRLAKPIEEDYSKLTILLDKDMRLIFCTGEYLGASDTTGLIVIRLNKYMCMETGSRVDNGM